MAANSISNALVRREGRGLCHDDRYLSLAIPEAAEGKTLQRCQLNTLIGLPVQLERAADWRKPCHDNVDVIVAGRGPHAAELRCSVCNAHRGWLCKTTANFLSKTVRSFGVPSEPFLIRDANGETSMLIDELYPSNYLKATDLKGHEATVEIENVAVETIGRDGERRPVASLVGKKKKFVLNKTNLRAIGVFLGPETANWPGKWIVIYPTTTDYAGKETACLRVKPPRDNVKPSVAAKARNGQVDTELDDETGF